MNRESIEQIVDSAKPEEPIDPIHALLPYKPFPVEILPEPVGSFVRTCAASLGCDPAYITVPLLPALASLIGNARRIQLKAGWLEPPVIWAVTVGESGTMKTPGFQVAMKALRELQHDEMRAFEDRRAKFELEEIHYDKEMREWKQKGSGEPPEKPIEPQPARFIVSDTTVEALLPILKHNWRGVILARDELGGWISSFDRYAQARGADAAHWLSMFNAETVINDRKTGPDRTIMVERAAVCITGGIQPGMFRRAIGNYHRENGLLARFLIAWPPRRVKKWTDTGITPEMEAKLGALCDRHRELEPQRFDDRVEPVIIRLSSEAKARWVRFVNEHAQEQSQLTGDLCAAWSKLEAYTARLALLVHCIRWAANDPTQASEAVVDEVSLAAGITLTQWFGYEARRVYLMLDENEDDQARRHLIELIERTGGSTTVRQWQQRRSHRTSQDAEAELTDLQAHGYGQLAYARKKGPGPQSKVFKLHPAPDTGFDTYATPSGGPETDNTYVSEPSGARRQVADLLRQLRRDGHRDRAIDVRDEWRERLAITTIDGGLTEAQGQVVAFESVLTMLNGLTPTIKGGAS